MGWVKEYSQALKELKLVVKAGSGLQRLTVLVAPQEVRSREQEEVMVVRLMAVVEAHSRALEWANLHS